MLYMSLLLYEYLCTGHCTWASLFMDIYAQDVVHELAKKLGYRSRDIGETWLQEGRSNGTPDILKNGTAF